MTEYPFLMGKVSNQPPTSRSDRSPPLRQPCPPLGAHGACDSSGLPKIRAEVIQHYRNRGAIAAGQSPWSVSVFLIIGRCTFLLFHVSYAIFLIFPSKSLLNTGVKITRLPFLIFFLDARGVATQGLDGEDAGTRRR